MSSSSSSISTTTVNGTTRITGLSSSIDVDSIVEQMVTAEKEKKLNALQQKEQLAQWRQDAYRTIISEIQDFTDTYFSVGTSSTSLLSSKNLNQYTVTSSSSAITASYTSAASAGSHEVTVSQLATYATRSSSSSISKEVQGGTAASYTSLSGTSITITVDGSAHTVSLDDVTDVDSLQDAIDDAVGDGMLTVSANSSGILSITAEDSGVGKITLSDPSSGTSGLDALGFSESGGAILSNRLDTSDTLSEIADQLNTSTALSFNSEGQIALKINGVSFTFDKDETTLEEMISEINDSDCGATMAYNESTGKLVLTADDTGAGDTLTVSETADEDGVTSNFLTVCLGSATDGKNATVTIDGQAYTRSSNTFTVSGVTYTLNDITTDDEDTTATVSLTLDSDGIYDTIKSFVDDYNTLIDTIKSELDENYDSDYLPLTDDQKEAMTDEEIEDWETQAKAGILEDDSTLTSMLRELRSIFIDSTSGSSTTIFDIGIDTSDDYEDGGKLVIDEDALKEAITSDTETVVNLFTKQSTSYSGASSKIRTYSSDELSTRYDEEGIAYRFYDVLSKYTSTVRDSSGTKGLLIEKAGVENDASETDNYFSDQLTKYAEKISDEEDRLDSYEDKLYERYTTLETYINNMNTQLSALSSYLSSSTS